MKDSNAHIDRLAAEEPAAASPPLPCHPCSSWPLSSLAAAQRCRILSTCCGSGRSVTEACSPKPWLFEWSIFAIFVAATFFILYGSFAALKRAHLPDLPSSHTIFFGGQPVKLPVEPVMRFIGFGGSIVIALVTGAGMMAEWPTLALFWYAPRGMGGVPGAVVDPIFLKPVTFFLFTLPAWQLISGWLLTLAVITCVIAIFFILITGGAGVFAGRRSYLTLPWRGFSITFAFFLLILAMRVYLDRFELLFEDHTVFGRCHLHRRAHHAHRHAPGLRGPGCRCVRGSRQRDDGGARTLAGRGDPSRGALFWRRSGGRLVDEQLHRQTQ